MKAIYARERRITAVLCTITALLCVLDVGQALRQGRQVDVVEAVAGTSLLAIAAYSLFRARRGT